MPSAIGRPLRFGTFIAPFHPPSQNPTLALERDLELIQWLDQLGFDEAWVGEHHSAGMEIISCPEIFIAAAAERTRHIRLGTGVVSLPYHHPLMVANRLVQLDHMTRGRVMFGVGPGALPSDAYMMGIDPDTQRRRMEESLEAITALLRGDEPVSRETDWFTLREGRLHLRPYTWPRFEIAVAAQVSPAGPRTAGRFGGGLLSLGATSMGGFDVLGQQLQVWQEAAEAAGGTVDRADWRLVGPMHIAETREQAFEDVQYGLPAWVDYFRNVVVLPIGPVTDSEDPEEWARVLVDSGFAVIGDPDDAVAQIERLEKQTGGFGAFLTMHNEWADRDATRRSYELMAREVFPRFQGSSRGPEQSMAWARADRPTLLGGARDAVVNEIRAHKRR